MTRRDYGSGSITARGPGRWQLRWYTAVDPITGRRRRRAETFAGTKRDAMRRLAELAGDHTTDGAATTLRGTIAAWRAQAGHAPSTAANYDRAVATIPAPFLAVPINAVTAAAIRAVLDHVQREHGVHRTRQVHAVISGALTHAWRHEWIPGNPARKVQPPAQPASKARAPTTAQVQALLELVAGQPEMHAWLLLSAVAGGRRGEILALHWSDIDLDRGQVSIVKALDPATGGEKATKTGNVRTVAVGGDTVAVLRRWRLAFLERAMACGVPPAADPVVFTADLAGVAPWRPDVATKRFIRLRDAAGLTCRLHDLRHYVATQLLGQGVALKSVSARLGHTRTATTADVYGHAIPADDLAAAVLLEGGLSGR